MSWDTVQWWDVRIIVADCSAEYSGRLNASLPLAKRVLLIKADNSLLIFSELGSYKPLNWMAAPCTLKDVTAQVIGQVGDESGDEAAEAGQVDAQSKTNESADSAEPSETLPQQVLRVSSDKSSDVLEVSLFHVYSDESYDLGEDPGLVKDGVEDHLQRYLAEQIERIGAGAKLVRREYPTAIGPVDIMAINADGEHVAVEIKRHGGIDGVEQLTRYCELLNRDPLLAPVHGIFAAQTITPQAQVLAKDRGFTCLILDYDEMKGVEDDSLRLF
nr:endonuclease NucS [Bifidobacterium sp. DSM 109957]